MEIYFIDFQVKNCFVQENIEISWSMEFWSFIWFYLRINSSVDFRCLVVDRLCRLDLADASKWTGIDGCSPMEIGWIRSRLFDWGFSLRHIQIHEGCLCHELSVVLALVLFCPWWLCFGARRCHIGFSEVGFSFSLLLCPFVIRSHHAWWIWHNAWFWGRPFLCTCTGTLRRGWR